MKTTLNLRYLPVKYTGMNKAEINFSAIEDYISDPAILRNVQVYFNMKFYQFANELANEDVEVIGWEYCSGDQVLIINYDGENCNGFYN